MGESEAEPSLMQSLLNPAIQRGDTMTVLVLLQKGTPVNFTESDNQTPLHHAVRGNHSTIVRALLRYGASLTAEDHNQLTPIQIAALHGNIEALRAIEETVDWLLKADSPPRPIGTARSP